MGEKGIGAESIGSLGDSVTKAGAAAGAGTVTASTIERATTVVTSAATDTASTLADTVRDKGTQAVADHLVAEGRERIKRRPQHDATEAAPGQAPPKAPESPPEQA